MSRPLRILRNVAIGLAALIAVLVVAVILIVQTDWFRNYVRETIMTSTEAGTGGEVEVGSFTFDWRKLEAIVTDFVIHGKEPQGSKPFARVARVQVNLRLFTTLKHIAEGQKARVRQDDPGYRSRSRRRTLSNHEWAPAVQLASPEDRSAGQ
jgi:hypothetical protein